MKRFLKRTALALAMTMVVTSAAPAAKNVFAANTFTYAYQNGGAVSTLNMEAGEDVDLRFIGVKDYKNYSLSWKSSAPDVATVDKNGVVTAKGNGTAVITLEVGDGTVYSSKGVAVTVGTKPAMTVVLGTSRSDTFSTYTLELDKTVDLNFYGVTDWSSNKYSTLWVSSNQTVATVNNMGIVTPVSAGKTTVTVVITDKTAKTLLTVIPVEISVPEAQKTPENPEVTKTPENPEVTKAPENPEVTKAPENPEVTKAPEELTFTAVQTSDSTVTLTFSDKDVTKAALENNLKFYYYVGDIRIAYPIQVDSVKDGVVVLKSYVTFGDGTKYGFEYKEASAEFTATIGEVTDIRYSWNCEGDEFMAYAGVDTTVTYKLLNAQGVDITETALAQSGASVMFTLVKESETGDFWISDANNGKIFFNAEGAAAQVEIEYITGKYDQVTYEPIPGPKAVASLVSSKAPAYNMNVSKGGTGTIVKNSAAAGSSIDWTKASTVIALGDDSLNNYRLVVKLTDTKNETVYTDSMDASKGTFSFATTNNQVLYVEEDGSLMTNNTGTVNVLVYFTPVGANSSSVVAVVPVTVRAARTVTSMVLDKTSEVISTKADNNFNEAVFTVTLKDQLGDNIAGDLEVTCNNKSLPNGATAYPVVSAVTGANGEYTFTVTGDEDNLPSGATGYAYTFTVKSDNISKTFSVTVKKPLTDSNGNLVISGYKVEFGGASDLKTTDDAAKNATATLYLLSNGVKAEIATLQPKLASVSSMVAGSYYYTVSKGSTALNVAAAGATSTAITIPLTNITTTAVNGIDTNVVDKTANGTGAYTVVIYKGIGSTEGATASTLTQVTRNTLTVKDSQDTVSYAGKSANSFAAMNGDVSDLVMSCFKFKLGNITLDDPADYSNIKVVVNANKVTDNGVLKAGSVCFVKTVDLYVETGEGTNTYVKHTVTVNDYVEVK